MITPLFIGGLGMQEMLLIALVVLLFFGGKKIPELMKGLGKGVRSFKEGMNNMEKEIEEEPVKKNKRMAADTDKQSFWEHLDVLRAAIVKSLLVAVVFRRGSILLQRRTVRSHPRAQRCRLHYLPPALFARRSGDGIRCAGFSREAHQHGTGWAVHHPHESRTMCRCSLCIAIHPLPVVSLRIACFIC